jgi:hypothetical protein
LTTIPATPIPETVTVAVAVGETAVEVTVIAMMAV